MDYFDDMRNFLRLILVVPVLMLIFWACASPTSSQKSVSSFTVSYNANGATSGSVPVDGNAYSSGAGFTVLGNTGSLAITGAPTFFGAFGGWTGAGGNGIYLPGATATIGSNLALYASWGGVVATMAGSTTAGSSNNATGTLATFTGPCGMVISGGNLYVADFTNNEIRMISMTSPYAVTTIAGSTTSGSADNSTGTSATFHGPYGLTTDGANLYVTDSLNNEIRMISMTAPYAVTTIAGSTTSGHLDNATGTSAGFNQPQGITISGTTLYVADLANEEIRTVSTSAPYQVVTMAGSHPALATTAPTAGYLDATGTAALFFGPCGVATDGTNIYVSEYDNNRIRQVAIAGAAVTTLAGSGSSGMTNGTGTAAAFNNPSGLTSDGSGNLYLADTGNHMVRKIVISTGTVTTVAGSGTIGSTNANGISASFHRPFGIAINGTSLYVADFDNNMIRLIQ